MGVAMTDDKLKQYNQIKRQVEEAQKKADQAEGALNQIMKQLKTEFGCKTLEEAEAKLRKLNQETKLSSKEFEKALIDFNEKWGVKLGD
jgi:DNA repair ATPase RecN